MSGFGNLFSPRTAMFAVTGMVAEDCDRKSAAPALRTHTPRKARWATRRRRDTKRKPVKKASSLLAPGHYQGTLILDIKGNSTLYQQYSEDDDPIDLRAALKKLDETEARLLLEFGLQNMF
ncbi:uncharacterized protein [Nothobranchius furzeri]|uniref:uncharacterized protein isoform X2 n=1 Tax=Nothobranchius furzeri TaxID=105023 RepID=UPI0039046713